MKCTACDSELDIGRDIIQVIEGVIGTRDFVPLEDALVFCSDDCLRKHFRADGGLIEKKRKVP